ncbi:hypothetical protein EV363DRAFT_1301256 [Boletus edulis]|nr:hypothetical protein EV363DRAFT_1301256 [Boletus edulis]
MDRCQSVLVQCMLVFTAVIFHGEHIQIGWRRGGMEGRWFILKWSGMAYTKREESSVEPSETHNAFFLVTFRFHTWVELIRNGMISLVVQSRKPKPGTLLTAYCWGVLHGHVEGFLGRLTPTILATSTLTQLKPSSAKQWLVVAFAPVVNSEEFDKSSPVLKRQFGQQDGHALLCNGWWLFCLVVVSKANEWGAKSYMRILLVYHEVFKGFVRASILSHWPYDDPALQLRLQMEQSDLARRHKPGPWTRKTLLLRSQFNALTRVTSSSSLNPVAPQFFEDALAHPSTPTVPDSLTRVKLSKTAIASRGPPPRHLERLRPTTSPTGHASSVHTHF